MEDSFNWDENNQDDRLEVLEEQERLSAEADAKEAEALVAKDEEEENKEKSGPELGDTAKDVAQGITNIKESVVDRVLTQVLLGV